MQHFRNNQFCSRGYVVRAFPWCVYTGCAAAPRCEDTPPRTHRDGIVPATRMELEWLVRSPKHCTALCTSPFFQNMAFFKNLNQCLEFLAVRLCSHVPQKLDLIQHFLVAELQLLRHPHYPNTEGNLRLMHVENSAGSAPWCVVRVLDYLFLSSLLSTQKNPIINKAACS